MVDVDVDVAVEVAVGLVAQGHQLVHGHAHVAAPAGEVVLHEGGGEPVDAGRYRGVGGEHAAGTHSGGGLVEGETGIRDGPPDALEGQESGVALVDVEHLGMDAQGVECPHPTDAQKDFLADALELATAVEAIGDEAVFGVVVVVVGVEQVQSDATHAGLPDRGHHWHPGDVHGDLHVGHRLQRHGVGVEAGEAGHLAATVVDLLGEIAVVVEQPHAHQGQTKGVGRLEVVTGQHAQPARVLRQARGHAELGGEVRHRLEGAVIAVLKPPWAVQRANQVVVDLGGKSDEPGIGGQCLQAALVLDGQHAGGVAHVVPLFAVDAPKQLLGPFVGDPAEVHGDATQRFEGGGEVGHHGEGLNGFHDASEPSRGYR